MLAGLVILAAGAVAPVAEAQQAPGAPSLYELVEEMKAHLFVDLTHAFRPGIPHWPGFDDEVRATLYHYDEGIGVKGAGFLAHEYCHPGHWGTHVDPPEIGRAHAELQSLMRISYAVSCLKKKIRIMITVSTKRPTQT